MLLLMLTGCNYESMSPSWLIDRTRILGVQAEVAGEPGLAEPRPGDRVVFRSLTAHPDYADFAVTWMGCLPDEADSFGCEVDMDAIEALFDVDTEELTTQELLELVAAAQEAGFLGFEPYFSPFLNVPADVLDGLDEDEKLEGLNYFLTLSAFPMEEDSEGELLSLLATGESTAWGRNLPSPAAEAATGGWARRWCALRGKEGDLTLRAMPQPDGDPYLMLCLSTITSVRTVPARPHCDRTDGQWTR